MGLLVDGVWQQEGLRTKDGQFIRPPTAFRNWVTPDGSAAANYAFDVTPARLVTALVTERGVCPASRDGLLSLYPERAAKR